MKPRDPGLLRRAANLGTAVVRHAADGFDRLDDAPYQQRLAVCQGSTGESVCTLYDAQRDICRDWHCGCSILKKARWKSEDCPQGRWPRASHASDDRPAKRGPAHEP